MFRTIYSSLSATIIKLNIYNRIYCIGNVNNAMTRFIASWKSCIIFFIVQTTY